MAIRIMEKRGAEWVARWATHSLTEQNDPNIGTKAEVLDLVIKREIEQLEKDFLPLFEATKTSEDYFRVWWETGRRLAWLTKVELAHPDDFEYLEQACYDHMGPAFAKIMGINGRECHYLERGVRLGRLSWQTARCFGVWDVYRKLSVHKLFLKENRIMSWLEKRMEEKGRWILADCVGYQSYAYRNFMQFVTNFFRHKDSAGFTTEELYQLFEGWIEKATKQGATELLADGSLRPPRDHKAEIARRATKQIKIQTEKNHEVSA